MLPGVPLRSPATAEGLPLADRCRSTRSRSRRRSTGSTPTVPFAELAPGPAARRTRRPRLERPRPVASTGSTRCGRSWTRVEKQAPWRDHDNWRDSALGAAPGFGAAARRRRSATTQKLSPRGSSTGSRGVEPRRGAPRRPSRRRCSTRCGRCCAPTPRPADQPSSSIPYRVDAYWCERRVSARSLRTRARDHGRTRDRLALAGHGRGQGATISGRVMNAVAPDVLAELARRPAGRARVGDERQDHDDAPARRAALEAEAAPVITNSPARTSRRASRPCSRAATTGRRHPRGRRAGPADGRRPARRRAARPRQPEPRPARPLRRGARRRRRVARGRRAPPRPARRGERVRPARRLGGRAGEDDVGRARARVAQRRGDVPHVRRAARLDRRTASTAPPAGSRSPATPNRLEDDALILDGAPRPAARSQLPGRWNLANAALARHRGGAHFGVDPDRRSGCDRRPSRPSPVATCRCRSATGARPACSSPRTRPAGPRCCSTSSDRRRLGRDRGERARRRRQGPVVAVGRAVRAAAGLHGRRRR